MDKTPHDICDTYVNFFLKKSSFCCGIVAAAAAGTRPRAGAGSTLALSLFL